MPPPPLSSPLPSRVCLDLNDVAEKQLWAFKLKIIHDLNKSCSNDSGMFCGTIGGASQYVRQAIYVLRVTALVNEDAVDLTFAFKEPFSFL